MSTKDKTATPDAKDNLPKRDSLGSWLQDVEEMGDLMVISAEVDPHLQMSTVAYVSGQEVGSPVLMFDNIKGHPGGRAVYNLANSSLRRSALTIREGTDGDGTALVKALKDKMRIKIPPNQVDAKDAIVNQNIETGDDIDIRKFPAPQMWPLDGGRYIGTGDAVITKDPETGRVNVGCYRQMIKSRNEVGYYASPGKDTLLDREKWWAMGKPAPVAAVYGSDPLLFMVASTSFPKDSSEYDFYGGISGEPIEVFESDVTGLPLPANAEIIIEGFSYPDKSFKEGPFGEFTGYYGRPGDVTPYIEIEKVRYKNNPILMCALMAEWPASECGILWSMTKAAKVWADLDTMGVPGIQGVWSPPEAAAWGMTVVSIKQMYAGHAAQTMALAAQCMGGAYITKYIVVVDDDVDPTSLANVTWAMVTRSRPAESIEILRETWSTYLDPSLNPPEIRPWGSKCLINACMEYKHLDTFSPRTKLSRPAYDEVVKRWAEFGFEGEAPKIEIFEDKDHA